MGGLFKPTENTSTSSQTSGPAKQYQSAYASILKQAQDIAKTPYNPATESQVAGFTSPQTQAFGQVQSNQGVYQPYMQQAFASAQQGSAPSYANVQSYMNPYQQSVIDATQQQFDTQNQRQLQDVRSQVAKQGALGGSGRQVAEALTKEAQMNAQNPVIANLYNQGYSQALNASQTDASRALQAAQVTSGLGGQAQQYGYNDVNALLGIGGLQQGLQQAQYDTATQNAQQQAAYPYQQLQWLSGIATGLGGASGTTTTGSQTTPGPSLGQQLIGGGLAAASFFQNGGRVGYEGGGTVIPFPKAKSYIPEISMSAMHGGGPSPSLAQASGTPSNGMGDILSSYKQAHSALAGLSNLGQKMRTSTDADSGWSTTVNPSGTGGWGNYLGNMASGFGFSHGGMVRGYADGGDVLDLFDDGSGVYATNDDGFGMTDDGMGSWFGQQPSDTDVSAVVPEQAAVGTGVAPVHHAQPQSQGSGLFGLSDAARQGLLQAGLGIMASRSPNVGNALGEGGLLGARAYEDARKVEEAKRIQRAKVAQSAASLQQRAQQASEALKMKQQQFDMNQRYRDAQIKKIESETAQGRIMEVGGKLVRVGPDGTATELYSSGTGTSQDDKSPAGRAKIAEQFGLDPNSDAGRAYILTGKLPREDQQMLTATDKKAILESDDKVATNQAVLKALDEAMALNDKANQGWFAGTRASIGNNLPDIVVPDFVSSPESSAATTNLDNAVVGQALTQLKAVFGGNPTEGERKILLDLQGSSSQPKAVRKEIFERAKRAAQSRLAINAREAEQLRGGTYYKPGGGSTGGPAPVVIPSAPAPVSDAPAVGTVMDGYKFKGGNPADPSSWEKN
jgi:hypothetical protein